MYERLCVYGIVLLVIVCAIYNISYINILFNMYIYIIEKLVIK